MCIYLRAVVSEMLGHNGNKDVLPEGKNIPGIAHSSKPVHSCINAQHMRVYMYMYIVHVYTCICIKMYMYIHLKCTSVVDRVASHSREHWPIAAGTHQVHTDG